MTQANAVQNLIDKIIRLKAADIILDLMEERQSLDQLDSSLKLEDLSLWLVENGLGDIERNLKKRLQEYVEQELNQIDYQVDLDKYFQDD